MGKLKQFISTVVYTVICGSVASALAQPPFTFKCFEAGSGRDFRFEVPASGKGEPSFYLDSLSNPEIVFLLMDCIEKLVPFRNEIEGGLFETEYSIITNTIVRLAPRSSMAPVN